MTMITAHTGCEGTPKNSLTFIQAALKSGAECMEIDLRVRGSQVVLSHDPLMEGQDYVTLEQCLQTIQAAKIWVNCDLKGPEAFPQTLELFRKHSMEHRLIFTGAYPLDRIMQEGGYKVFINAERLINVESSAIPSRDMLDKIVEWCARSAGPLLGGLNFSHRAMTDETVRILRDSGIPLSLWTIDDPADLHRAFDWQVFNITTNRPVSALAAREQRAAERENACIE